VSDDATFQAQIRP